MPPFFPPARFWKQTAFACVLALALVGQGVAQTLPASTDSTTLRPMPVDFDFLLVATAANPELDMWRHTLRGTALIIPAVTQAYRGQMFSLVLIFQGFQVDNAGNAEVTYSFTIQDPDGTVVLSDNNLEGVSKVGMEADLLVLAKHQVELRFESGDPFGDYTISVTARDGLSGKIRKRQVIVPLVPFGRAQGFDSMEEYRRWLPTYYLQPDPVRAFLAYLQYAELDNAVTGQLDFSQIAFFQYLFQKHPFLIQALIDSYPDADQETRLKVLFMLALLDYRDAPYLATLPEPEKAYFENARLLFPPEPYEELVAPQQLDMLWAEFYASGRFAPIKQIVEGLTLTEYAGALAELDDGMGEKDFESRANAYRDVLLQSVRWSLLSNSRQHPLVRAYCGYLYQEGGLSEPVRQELAAMLATADATPSRVGLRRGIPEQVIPNPFRN